MDSSTNSLDDAAADSGADSTERATETRLQAQEDELTLLKASLADALRRIRLHDGLLLMLKQQLIAVNPAAAGLINQICCHEGANIFSSLDRVLLCECSQRPRSISGPATTDRSTQTEAGHPEPKAVHGQAALSGGAQSLHLEDAFPLRAELQRAPSAEEGEDTDDHDGAARRETEPTRTAAGEEPVWTSAGGPQNGRDRPEDASLDQNLGPLSSVRKEAQHKPLLRRNSEKLGNLKRQVKRLDRKAASSATLLSRSPSLENHVKELVASAGSPGSRRRTYGQGQSIKMFIRGRPITMYVPSAIQNYHELKTEAPPQSLELDWVYGYRGRDCRANLYTLPSGEAVYFVARVVVLYHVDQRTQRHYRRHSDCVRWSAERTDWRS